MGISGDMFAGALLELCPDRAAALGRLNALGIPGTVFSAETARKCGIAATRLSVKIHGAEEGAHHHAGHEGHAHAHAHGRTLDDVMRTVRSLHADSRAKDAVEAVYRSIAEAEGRAHGKPAGEVHFHEVGSLDAIADIAAAVVLADEASPGAFVFSPVHTGCGTVECAHGTMPVPAPATAFLLLGAPSYSDGETRGELCTPTGAALARHFAASFGPQPAMRVLAAGCGAGSRDFARPNILRIFTGEPFCAAGASGEVAEITFEVDDMTGEEIAFACSRIRESGALDVSTAAVSMKKGRPGVRFTVLCRPERRESAVRAVFANTSTAGARETICRRYEMSRAEGEREIAGGARMRFKTLAGFGAERAKYEADDIAALADAAGISFSEARLRAGNPPLGGGTEEKWQTGK